VVDRYRAVQRIGLAMTPTRWEERAFFENEDDDEYEDDFRKPRPQCEDLACDRFHEFCKCGPNKLSSAGPNRDEAISR
jgi:hypothetical protein